MLFADISCTAQLLKDKPIKGITINGCQWHELPTEENDPDGKCYVHHYMNTVHAVYYPTISLLIITEKFTGHRDEKPQLNLNCENFEVASFIAHRCIKILIE